MLLYHLLPYSLATILHSKNFHFGMNHIFINGALKALCISNNYKCRYYLFCEYASSQKIIFILDSFSFLFHFVFLYFFIQFTKCFDPFIDSHFFHRFLLVNLKYLLKLCLDLIHQLFFISFMLYNINLIFNFR